MINITIITTVASSHSTPHLDLALDIFSFQIFSWVPIFTALVLIACIKEGNSKGGENDGRLLIGFYYSAVTGNRKQVLTGSSESCEHKCR